MALVVGYGVLPLGIAARGPPLEPVAQEVEGAAAASRHDERQKTAKTPENSTDGLREIDEHFLRRSW